MPSNFTAIDVMGAVESSLALTFILFIPGYVIGWLTNLFDFRARRLGVQAVLSTPLAVAVLPISIYILGPYPKILWTLFCASWLAFLFLVREIWKRWRRIGILGVPRAAWVGGAIVVAWALLAIFSLVDLQYKDRLYFSSTAYDYSTRTEFTAAAARAIPPSNPFFAMSPPVPLRYHHFWFLICSLVARAGLTGPRQAIYGGTVWAGIAFFSLIVMSLMFFAHVRENLGRKALIGCGLLLVTGLDILPTLYLFLRFNRVYPDMESWNEPIISWLDGLLWTQHHNMSLVACVVGLLALRQPISTSTQRIVSILFAGLAFASATGLSIYVTFTFAVFIALWLPYAALRRYWDEVLRFLEAGGIAFVAALPYLRSLTAPGLGDGGRFAELWVRNTAFGLDAISWIFRVPYERLPAPRLLLLLLLPLNYFVELGFFFVVGLLRIKSLSSGSTAMTREEKTGWAMVATSFLVGSFLRSATIDHNDLGWRCFLPAQLMLLIWAAVMIDDWWSGQRFGNPRKNFVVGFAGVLLVLGVVGSTYQVAMLRAYPILADAGMVDARPYKWLDQDRRLGERTFALRSAYDSLEAILPPDAIVQYNPDEPAFIPHQLYSRHDAAIGLPLCGSAFGGDVAYCLPRIISVPPLFNTPSPFQSAGLDRVCRAYNIEIMLVDDRDRVWNDRQSWVWTRDPLIANQHVRAFACGDSAQRLRLTSAR